MRAYLFASLSAVVFLAGACHGGGDAARDGALPDGFAKSYEAQQSGAEESSPPSASSDGAFCQEHGVLEAVCTKCNPALIPVFQAKGDWCAEHGLPESFCPICHPERGGQPTIAIVDDGAPAQGTRIHFRSEEMAEVAGIETVPAVAGPSGGEVVAPVTIVHDATRLAQVNARAPGVVRLLKAEVGDQVRRGVPIAVLESAAIAGDRSRIQAVRARLKAAEETYAREKDLSEKGISSRKDLLAAQEALEAAKADMAAAEAALGMVGSANDEGGVYSVLAPIAGLVSERMATVGQLVDSGDPLFEVVDPSIMWAEIAVPEAALASIAVGQPVTLTVDGIADREFTGTIATVAPKVDPRTRSATARVVLPNPDGVLRANMYGRARIRARGSGLSVLVPKEAVQRAKDVHLVFVPLAVDEFETRRVRLGAASGGLIEILGGVSAGEQVVTTGSFLLKTETLKESIGAGCCDVEPPKGSG